MEEVETYLATLPRTVLDGLYADPSTCQAVFRLLPPLAKCWLLRLAFGLPCISGSRLLQQWTTPASRGQGELALRRLVGLRILTEQHLLPEMADPEDGELATEEEGGYVTYALNTSFRDNFRELLSGSGTARWEEQHKAVNEYDGEGVSKEFLSEFSTSCWNAILLFIMGSTATQPPSDRVVSLLICGEFVTVNDDDRSVRIADKGFPFLLKDLRTQAWTLLLIYLKSLENNERGMQRVLSFLFCLSFLTVGKGYNVNNSPLSGSELLKDLQDLGIVYRRREDSRWIYPTQLGVDLSAAGTAKSEQEGWIVISTDYRIYAYTSNPVKILLLSLFVYIEYELPDMVMGRLLRDNIRQAVKVGISAHQILHFLETHAHPQMRQNKPIVPEAIADQIRLWEAEDKRVSLHSGYFYDDFPSLVVFTKALRYARELGVLIHANESKQYFFVNKKGHPLIRGFLKQLLASQSS